MGERSSLAQSQDETLGAIVSRFGGEFSVKPFGRARAVVAEREAGGRACGLAYVVPPGRLMRHHAAQGRAAQSVLARMIAEIDLLAVDADVRGRGIGTAVLGEAERWLESRGCRVVMAKVARGDYEVMRWYRRRGYLIAAQQEPFWASLPGFDLRCDDGNDGYQLALKGLGVSLRRARMGAGTYVTVRSSRVHPQARALLHTKAEPAVSP